MFAVIKTGGKQYIVREGEELKVEKLEVENGEKIEFDALLMADEEGSNVTIGTPTVKDVKVIAGVVETGKGKKIEIIKFKAKSNYRRHTGHRQPFTKIKIEKIG